MVFASDGVGIITEVCRRLVGVVVFLVAVVVFMVSGWSVGRGGALRLAHAVQLVGVVFGS